MQKHDSDPCGVINTETNNTGMSQSLMLTRSETGCLFECLQNDVFRKQNDDSEYFEFIDTDGNHKRCKYVVLFGGNLNFCHYCHLLKLDITPENVMRIQKGLKERSKHDKSKRISNVKGMDALTLIVTDDNQIIRYDTVHECKINKSRHSLVTTYFVSEDLNKIEMESKVAKSDKVKIQIITEKNLKDKFDKEDDEVKRMRSVHGREVSVVVQNFTEEQFEQKYKETRRRGIPEIDVSNLYPQSDGYIPREAQKHALMNTKKMLDSNANVIRNQIPCGGGKTNIIIDVTYYCSGIYEFFFNIVLANSVQSLKNIEDAFRSRGIDVVRIDYTVTSGKSAEEKGERSRIKEKLTTIVKEALAAQKKPAPILILQDSYICFSEIRNEILNEKEFIRKKSSLHTMIAVDEADTAVRPGNCILKTMKEEKNTTVIQFSATFEDKDEELRRTDKELASWWIQEPATKITAGQAVVEGYTAKLMVNIMDNKDIRLNCYESCLMQCVPTLVICSDTDVCKYVGEFLKSKFGETRRVEYVNYKIPHKDRNRIIDYCKHTSDPYILIACQICDRNLDIPTITQVTDLTASSTIDSSYQKAGRSIRAKATVIEDGEPHELIKNVAYLNVRQSQLVTVINMQERYGGDGAIEIGYTDYSIENSNKIQPHMFSRAENRYEKLVQTYEQAKNKVYKRNFLAIANKAQDMLDMNDKRSREKLKKLNTKISFCEDYVDYEYDIGDIFSDIHKCVTGKHSSLSLPENFECKITIRETEKTEHVRLDEKSVKFTEEDKLKLRSDHDRCLIQEDHDFIRISAGEGHYEKTFGKNNLPYRIKTDSNSIKTLRHILPSFEVNGFKFIHTSLPGKRHYDTDLYSSLKFSADVDDIIKKVMTKLKKFNEKGVLIVASDYAFWTLKKLKLLQMEKIDHPLYKQKFDLEMKRIANKPDKEKDKKGKKKKKEDKNIDNISNFFTRDESTDENEEIEQKGEGHEEKSLKRSLDSENVQSIKPNEPKQKKFKQPTLCFFQK